MQTYKHQGWKFRAHDADCASAFREDRDSGLVYGPVAKPNGSLYLSWEDASMACDFCAYCGPTEFVSQNRERAPH